MPEGYHNPSSTVDWTGGLNVHISRLGLGEQQYRMMVQHLALPCAWQLLSEV